MRHSCLAGERSSLRALRRLWTLATDRAARPGISPASSKGLLTDESGAIKPSGEQGHYPFGESWYDATPADPEFTSYSRDEESGLDDAVFRQYSSEFGRFTMPDPIAGHIGQPQSWNRYAYVWNDAVKTGVQLHEWMLCVTGATP